MMTKKQMEERMNQLMQITENLMKDSISKRKIASEKVEDFMIGMNNDEKLKEGYEHYKSEQSYQFGLEMAYASIIGNAKQLGLI